MTISQFPLPEGGIPTGNTAGRPASPVIGDVYYNGQTAILEIYDGTTWVACSAPPAAPTVSVADVGTSRAYGSAQGTATFTAGSGGGPALEFTVNASTGGYSATTSGTTVTITVGDAGTWVFSAQGRNNFGTSVSGASTSVALTTVPQAPTIGTATTSSGTTNVSVSWTLGNNGGKNLTAIEIVPYLNGTTAQTATTAATTTATSATITGLTGGSAYTFKVKATNANGTSLESSASNSITVPSIFSVDYLVVAGGGGGGCRGGGGGAGGLRSTMNNTGGGGSLESALNVTKGINYTVTVGAGGAGSTNVANKGTNGENSVFSTVTSTGGGGGASDGNTGGASGGSGGGGANSGTGAAGTANQGYAGGNATGDGNGGGGGAGAAGATGASVTIAGNGGSGVSVSITGSAVNYAGGGGGGSSGGTDGLGGAGGGGNANQNAQGEAGDANKGGGGGAGGRSSGGTVQNGGAGGSGVVILRWLTSAGGTITVGAGLTADATGTDGSYSYKKITAGTGNVSWS